MSYRYAFKELAASLLREPVTILGSVFTLALSLLVFNSFLLVTLNLKKITDDFKSRMEIEVYLKDGLKEKDISLLYSKLRSIPAIEEVTFKSKNDALKEMKKYFDPELLEGLQTNPLPASYLVRLKQPYKIFATMEKVSSQVKGFEGVEDVEYGGEWVKRIDQTIFVFSLVDIFFGLLIAILVVMIVSGNIRNMINLKRESLEISKLLGADAAFITRPFFLQGLIYGALAGVTSLLLLYLVCRAFSSTFFRIGFLPVNLALIIVLATVLLGGVGSLISVRSHT